MDRTRARIRAYVSSASLLALLTLTACGGGGGGGDGIRRDLYFPAETAVLESDPNLDGVVDYGGYYEPRAEGWAAHTGDLEETIRPGYDSRQLYAFFLGPVPVGARVFRAELRLYQVEVEGNPYRKNGNVVVDHVDYVADPGLASYDHQDLERRIGTLSTNAFLEVKTLDVTDAVRADVEARRTWAQFRLRFWKEVHHPILDLVNDYVCFTDAEGLAGGPRPELVVTYQR